MAGNKDRRSPEGFCAYLHHQFTGQWPSENDEQIQASAEVINGRLEFAEEDLALHYASADNNPLRDIYGVQIFHAGIHRDSKGNEREWTQEQLEKMVSNFDSKVISEVPLKLGHTSMEHNSQVAKALGIPAPILLGEEGLKKGAASLGKVKRIFIGEGGIVRSDFEMNPKVEQLVKDGFFKTVSAEIVPDYKGQGPALSGLALLGADRPAIKSLDHLAKADFLGQVLRHSDLAEGAEVYLLDLQLYSDDPSDPNMSNDQLMSADEYRVPITEIGQNANRQTVHRVTTVRHVKAANADEAKRKVKTILKNALAYTFNLTLDTALRLVFDLAVADIQSAYARSYTGKPIARKLPMFGSTSEGYRQEEDAKLANLRLIRSSVKMQESTEFAFGGLRSAPKGIVRYIITFGNVTKVRKYGRRSRYDEGAEAHEYTLALALATIGAYKVGKKLYQATIVPKTQTQEQMVGAPAQNPVVVNVWGYSPKHAELKAQEALPPELQATSVTQASTKHEEEAIALPWPDLYPDTLRQVNEFSQTTPEEKRKDPPPPSIEETLINVGMVPAASAGFAKAQDLAGRGLARAKRKWGNKKTAKKVATNTAKVGVKVATRGRHPGGLGFGETLNYE